MKTILPTVLQVESEQSKRHPRGVGFFDVRCQGAIKILQGTKGAIRLSSRLHVLSIHSNGMNQSISLSLKDSSQIPKIWLRTESFLEKGKNQKRN
jgi:hypothetical protein